MGHLTVEQRYTIQVLKEEGFNQSRIAEKIQKDKSVVCRELQRNCDKRSGEYKAELAEKKCAHRHKAKSKRIKFNPDIQQYTEELLKEDYSPEQIVGVSKRQGKEYVSAERIYQHIWKDKKQGGTLYTHLRTKGKRYRKRGAAKDKRGQIPDKVSIEERPKIVDEKTRMGDVEIDLVIGKNHKKAILTANDRVSGKAKMALLSSKSAAETKEKVVKTLRDWKPFLQTLTSDNGKEFALHKEIAQELEIDYFFAKPYHSWERGANENLNGLIRQYFPKDHDFNQITEKEIQYVENKLNNRPRKRFGFLTPNQVYLQLLIKTG